MEILVVLGLIGMIAAFVIPRLSKSFGKAAITEVVSALGSITGQVEALCGTKGTVPDAAGVAAMISGTPNQYNAPTVNGTSCAAEYQVIFGSASLPKICAIRGSDGSWKYNWVVASPWQDDDIPIPTSKKSSSACK